MKIHVLREAGLEEAMLGLSLSYDQPIDKMPEVARKLMLRGGAHTKFLESIVIWLDITAPRYWWQQFDTYRVGVTKQSGSTMHNILKSGVDQTNFEGRIPRVTLERINELIFAKAFIQVKRELPEAYLQRRIVCSNYNTINHIMGQRWDHRLEEWHLFCNTMREVLTFKEFLP